MVANNILLAAIPRSGSTLSCHLLNQFSDCLAMIEPLDMSAFSCLFDAERRLAYLADFFDQTRQQVRSRGKVPVMVLENETTNTFTSYGEKGRTSSITGIGWEQPKQTITDNFTLVIKHPNAFSALLGELKNTFSCYALVRNPLAILASWNSLDHPLREGHAPMAEVFDANLQQTLAGIDGAQNRQLHLLDWYFRKFRHELEAGRILRYEDTIASNGASLSVISGVDAPLKVRLTNQNRNSLYDDTQTSNAASALLGNSDNACWHFYSRNEVEQLAKL